MNFSLRRVLVLSKRTRYELEKARRPGITDEKLENIIRKRGSDFDTLIKHHGLHKEFHSRLLAEFARYNLDVLSVTRSEYTAEAIDWADMVVPAGGDGTFLVAASRVMSRGKPVVGFNSDPTRSEGHLCLPKPCSHRLAEAVDRIVKGRFTWAFRNRIQIELTGPRANEDSIQLDECPYPSFNHLMNGKHDGEETIKPVKKVIPYLALNEVFLGESLSSQVSYFEIILPGHPRTKVKCSGLCVCTGTGSTSWHLSINRLSREKVARLLTLLPHQEGQPPSPLQGGQQLLSDEQLDELAERFNASLVFPPDDPRLHYTLRDQIVAGVWPHPAGLPSEAFVEGGMSIVSKCTAANLVVDGGWCYPFNDGTIARLSSHPDNALRTIRLED